MINAIGSIMVMLIIHLHPWAPIVIGLFILWIGIKCLIKDTGQIFQQPRRTPDGFPVGWDGERRV